MKHLILALTLCATPIAAACPMVLDTSGKKQQILADLAGATDFKTSRTAVNDIWTYWRTAPDAQSQEWLDEGVERIRYGDLEKAKSILMGLVDYCPTYAEAYNQLAFAQFMAEDYDASAINLGRAMELEPAHFGAIAGMGLINERQGNLPAAKIWIAKAVKIHPFLNERYILDIPEKTDEL